MTLETLPCEWRDGAGRAYAGIGSRSTPDAIQALMRRIARTLALHEWILRSGHAKGADQAFESGVSEERHAQWELYLPWHGFEGCEGGPGIWCAPGPAAHDVAARHHPTWARCSRGVRAILARDVQEVLGADCDRPSSFVLCWTQDGAVYGAETSARTGGTGQAIRVASAYGVPVYNLARADHREMWSELA